MVGHRQPPRPDRAFGGRTSLSYSHANNSDGRRDAAAVVQPFYALDTRWAAGLTAFRDSRIDAFYNAGAVASQYRRRQQQAEADWGTSHSGVSDNVDEEQRGPN